MQISDPLTKRLRAANEIAFLTGAGVSAESGVSTFRDVDGHWARFDPQSLASMQGFRMDPVLVQRWYGERIRAIRNAVPNAGHVAIAQMQRRFGAVTVITQNVDGLHQGAGASEVLELHGNIHSQRCASCGTPGPVSIADVDEAELPLRCEGCADYIRPEVVWFGEQLPHDTFAEAEQAVTRADVVFSVGTSAVVYPAASLIGMAKRSGAYVVEVNIVPSDAAHIVDEVIVGQSGVVLPRLLDSDARPMQVNS